MQHRIPPSCFSLLNPKLLQRSRNYEQNNLLWHFIQFFLRNEQLQWIRIPDYLQFYMNTNISQLYILENSRYLHTISSIGPTVRCWSVIRWKAVAHVCTYVIRIALFSCQFWDLTSHLGSWDSLLKCELTIIVYDGTPNWNFRTVTLK